MTTFVSDPHLQLAFSLYENKGVYAVLLGSGMSRAAQIPTGWEITVDLIRRVGLAQGVEDQADWAAWYRAETGNEPNYSTLLEALGSSPDERRAILHRYIEPTEPDREEGRKVPTTAHRSIAQLVRQGYIRVIVTTNFDRLMENALRECGVEPTIVGSVDALRGAEPLTHSTCFILKIHGDYKDARILNTDTELSAYPAEYDQLLDRILDEYGLIVCGWSGEWDHALRAAILRAPNRRYSMYWAARGSVGGGAEELIQQRAARVIPIADADGLFSTLLQRIDTLEQSQQQNPRSIELLVNSAKRLLVKPEHRIQLDELYSQETGRVLELLKHEKFSPQGQWDQAVFRARVRKLEALTEGLACMVGVLGRWGDGSELPLVVDTIRSILAEASKIRSGVVVYINLRSYPATLVFTAYALGLTRAERWAVLHDVFDVVTEREHREPVRAVESLFLQAWKGTSNDAWKNIEGRDRDKTPFSDHLFSLFADWSKRFAGLTSDFEMMFERFEMLGSLAHLEREEATRLQSGLAGDQWGNNFVWMPVGRVGWHSANNTKLIGEITSVPTKSKLLGAGFGKGDSKFFDMFIENFKRMAGRMEWM